MAHNARKVVGVGFPRLSENKTFRSPGKLDPAELRLPKAEVYQARYEGFRSGVKMVRMFVDETTVAELEGVTFAFVCVDKGSSRAGIFKALIAKGIPFIDMGMGLNRKRGPVNGLLRVTFYGVPDVQARVDAGLAPIVDSEDELYRTNIQIGELNAVNAALAVIRYKQWKAFYLADGDKDHLLFEVADLKIVNG